MQELLALLRNGLHSLLVDTIQALEETGRTVCDVTNTGPWECTMDLARQVWDKARQVDIFTHLLAHVEGSLRESPETVMAWRSASAQAPEERVAGIDRGLEGLAGDALAQLMVLARQVGDPVMEHALNFMLADELTHACMRRKWLRELPANAPERLRKALQCQQRIDA